MNSTESPRKGRWYTRRPAVVGAVVLAFLGISGTAYAYWTTGGSGTAYGKTGTSQSLTITELDTVPNPAPTGMTPGGPDQYIYYSITNPLSTAQWVASITITITSVTYTLTENGHTAGNTATTCAAADFAVTSPTWTAQDVAPGTTNYTTTGTAGKIHMIDAAYNQDDCKDVTVNLSFSST